MTHIQTSGSRKKIIRCHNHIVLSHVNIIFFIWVSFLLLMQYKYIVDYLENSKRHKEKLFYKDLHLEIALV